VGLWLNMAVLSILETSLFLQQNSPFFCVIARIHVLIRSNNVDDYVKSFNFIFDNILYEGI